MSLIIFNPGDKIKSSEVNDNFNEVLKKINETNALQDLRLISLEVNAGVSGVTDNFEDIFSTADGVLGTVDTTNTTSIFENNYYFNNIIFINTTIYSTSSPTYTLLHSYIINNNTFDYLNIDYKNTHNVSSKIYFIIYYNDGTNTQTDEISAGNTDYVTRTINNPYPTKQVIKLDLYGYINSGYTMYVKNLKITYNETNNNEIYLNYNKGNPKSLYFALYSGVGTTDTSEIGDCTIELLTGTTSLGIYNPYTIYTGLSLASTPDKVIIHQADTSVSKISEFVMLIED